MFRRKHEFKPDRARHNALSKLYITPKQRLQILKWLLTAAVVVGVSVIQDSALSRFQIFGAKLNLTVVAMLLLCIMLDADVGSVFILAASAIYWFSGSAPGPYVIAILSAIGVLTSIICQAYLYESFGSILICTMISVFLYELLIFGLGCFLSLTTADRLATHMMGAALSCCIIPLLYPVFKAIDKIGGTAWNE